jgi:hypothetical protein
MSIKIHLKNLNKEFILKGYLLKGLNGITNQEKSLIQNPKNYSPNYPSFISNQLKIPSFKKMFTNALFIKLFLEKEL